MPMGDLFYSVPHFKTKTFTFRHFFAPFHIRYGCVQERYKYAVTLVDIHVDCWLSGLLSCCHVIMPSMPYILCCNCCLVIHDNRATP